MKHEVILQLETALDHLSGEEIGMAMQALNDMPEVLDAIYLVGIGKKNRQAGLLQVLCMPENEALVCMAVFRHTHTLGLRRAEIERVVLPRHECAIRRGNEMISAKAYELEDAEYVRPEADAVRDFAKRRGLGAPSFRFCGNALPERKARRRALFIPRNRRRP